MNTKLKIKTNPIYSTINNKHGHNKQVIEAIKLAITRRVLKVSDLQRKFRTGYNSGEKMMTTKKQVRAGNTNLQADNKATT